MSKKYNPGALEQCFKESAENLGMVWRVVCGNVRVCEARLSHGGLIGGSLKEDDSLIISMTPSEGSSLQLSAAIQPELFSRRRKTNDFRQNFLELLANAT